MAVAEQWHCAIVPFLLRVYPQFLFTSGYAVFAIWDIFPDLCPAFVLIHRDWALLS